MQINLLVKRRKNWERQNAQKYCDLYMQII